MKSIKQNAWLLALSFAFIACEKNDDGETPMDNENPKAYVVNEGQFQNNNGSISVIDSGVVNNNIFLARNGVSPGDVVQHITFIDNLAYIVVNNSQKVEVVNKNDFSSVATVTGTGLDYPRYAEALDGKIYVSNGFSEGNVTVIDTMTHQVLNTIPVGIAPDKMARVGNKLFVVNTGGFPTPGDTNSINNGSVSIIENDVEVRRVELFPSTRDIVVDNNNNVFVLCSGARAFSSDFTEVLKETEPYLVQLNENGDIVNSTVIGSKSEKPSQLEISSDGSLYIYQSGFVFRLQGAVKADTLLSNTFAYGMNIGPDDLLYLGFAGDFIARGYVGTYTLNGSITDSIQVGIAPNGVYFN